MLTVVETVIIIEALSVENDPLGVIKVVAKFAVGKVRSGVAELHDVTHVAVNVAHPAGLGDHAFGVEGFENWV